MHGDGESSLEKRAFRFSQDLLKEYPDLAEADPMDEINPTVSMVFSENRCADPFMDDLESGRNDSGCIEDALKNSQEGLEKIFLSGRFPSFYEKEKNKLSLLQERALRVIGTKRRGRDYVYHEDPRVIYESVLQSVFGESLIFVGEPSHDLSIHMERLSLLPEGLIRSFLKKGMKFCVGMGDAIFLSQNVVVKRQLETTPPRGYSDRKNWKGVPGCYSSVEKMAYAGVSEWNNNDVMLHEVGHGFGDLFGWDNDGGVINAHKRLYPKLCSYLQQGGAGGFAGRQEFLAESFQDFFILDGEEFGARYDMQWNANLRDMIKTCLTY